MRIYSLSLSCSLATPATVQFDAVTSLGNPTMKSLTWTKCSVLSRVIIKSMCQINIDGVLLPVGSFNSKVERNSMPFPAIALLKILVNLCFNLAISGFSLTYM